MSIKKIIIIFWGITLISPIGLFSFDLDSLNQFTGWDTTSSYELTQKLRIGRIDHLEVLSDGKSIFTADSGKYFRIWDIETGKITWMQQVAYMLPMCVSMDSILYFRGMGDSSGNLMVYNISAEEIIQIALNFFSNTDYYRIQIVKNSILLCSYNEISSAGPTRTTLTKSKCFNSDNLNEYPTHPFNELNNNYLFTNSSERYLADYIYELNDPRPNNNSKHNNKLIFNNGTNFEFDYKYYEHKIKRYKCYDTDETNAFLFVDKTMIVLGLDSQKVRQNVELKQRMKEVFYDTGGLIIGLSETGDRILSLNYEKLQLSSIPITGPDLFDYLKVASPMKELIITSSNGMIKKVLYDTLYRMIFLNDFKTSSNNIFRKQQVRFTPDVAPNVKKLVWDFGDGQQSTESQPVHLYRDAGIYSIKLTAIFENDSLSISRENLIHVKQLYYPDIIQDKYSGIAPLGITFQINSKVNFDSLVWNFGNDNIIKDISTTKFTFQDTGIHKISITCFIDDTQYVATSYARVIDPLNSNYSVISINRNNGEFSGSLTNYDITNFVFSDFLDNTLNSFFITRHRQDIRSYGANTLEENKFQTNLIFPYLKGSIIFQDDEHSRFSKYVIDGLINHSADSVQVYDRDGLMLFTKKIDSQTFCSINQKELYALKVNSAVIYDEFLDSIREVDFDKMIAPNRALSQPLIYVIKQGYINTVYTLIKLDAEKNFWFGRFDQNFDLKSSNIVNDFDYDNFVYKNPNELLFIDKTGLLTALDSNGNKLFNKSNEIYTKCTLVGGQYWLDYNLDKGIGKFKFYNFEGGIYREFVIPNLSNTDSCHSLGGDIHVNQDNSINLIWTEIDAQTNANIAHIYLPLEFDGQYPLSEIDNIAYPNPSDNYISIPVPAGKFISFDLYNIMGNRIECVYELIPSAGEDIIRLDISGLPIGAWYFRVNCTDSPLFGNFQKTK